MLTDWLIYLDLLEDYNYNTSFLRLITPVIFGIIESHYCNYTNGYGNYYSNNDGYVNGDGYGFGDDFGGDDGDGFGCGFGYFNSHDEGH